MNKCSCGCEHFRFKMTVAETYYNICRNCNHTLAEHLNLAKRKQAE